MKIAYFDESGFLLQAEDNASLTDVPNGAYPLTDEQFADRFNYKLVDGVVTYVHWVVEVTPEQVLADAVKAVRDALQAAILARYQLVQAAIGADFRNPAEFKIFAGFANAFQVPAQEFGAWEAEVWHQANQYKAQVIAGTEPMLTPAEAVAMMPTYPLEE
jgi:hypothetical protein